MTKQIDLLDKGYVRLIDSMGDDLSIVRAARVSHGAAWRSGNDQGSDRRLIRYLLKNNHTSPFEHVVFTFEVKAPLFVFRQWHRHRTWSFNEISARYTEMADEFYVPHPVVIGQQSTENKQKRSIVRINKEEYKKRADQAMYYRIACEQARSHYIYLLDCGWPRELARMVLPVAMYSKMYATVDLHNLLKFIHLRDHEGAQWEIQQYAKALKELIAEAVPVTLEEHEALCSSDST